MNNQKFSTQAEKDAAITLETSKSPQDAGHAKRLADLRAAEVTG